MQKDRIDRVICLPCLELGRSLHMVVLPGRQVVEKEWQGECELAFARGFLNVPTEPEAHCREQFILVIGLPS